MPVLRSIWAAVVAAVTVGATYAFVLLTLDHKAIAAAVGGFAVASIVAFIVAVVIGLPTAALLRRIGLLSRTVTLVISFFIGAILFPVILVFSEGVNSAGRSGIYAWLGVAFVFGALSALGGAIWWLMVGRRLTIDSIHEVAAPVKDGG